MNDNRDVISTQKKQEIANNTFNVDEELARMWQGLGPAGQESFQRRYQNGEVGNHGAGFETAAKDEVKDEDTEMGGDDTNDAEDTVGDQTL